MKIGCRLECAAQEFINYSVEKSLNWDFRCPPEIFFLQGHHELQLQAVAVLNQEWASHICLSSPRIWCGIYPQTTCKFIVPISKSKHAWDFAFDRYHPWIYNSGNQNWIPAGHRAAFIAYRNTNIFLKITWAKL